VSGTTVPASADDYKSSISTGVTKVSRNTTRLDAFYKVISRVSPKDIPTEEFRTSFMLTNRTKLIPVTP
jgi:hypothetical protein